jgi:glutaredoxin
MKIIYSTPTCPACKQLKERYKAEGVPFKEMMIGQDISKEEFFSFFPNVRTVPYVVDTESSNG